MLKFLNWENRVLMEEERWQNLEVWRSSDELAFQVYNATKQFPKVEMFGLTSQIRVAAWSVPTNLVEGYSRKGDKKLAKFVNISLGSLGETKYLLYFSGRLSYFNGDSYEKLKNGYRTLGKLLWRFNQKARND